ncbi:hypothetical protein [Paenibacillus medicaginis]|uniref:Uncharacterized protein n=1 Tax=Paenibacillus medicaginis TaxID=1470560 RepID=A0ABV5BV55_9BACL
MKRSDANKFEIVTHHADEEEFKSHKQLENEVVIWMEYILKKYTLRASNDL